MAVTYTVAVKTDRITATRDYFANGTLEILDGASVLATFGLSGSGGTISGDTWTLTFDATEVSATGTGTADLAQIKNSGGTAGLTGLTVALSGGDVTIDNTSIAAGQSVAITAAAIQHA